MRKSLSRGICACLAVVLGPAAMLGTAGSAKALCLQPSPVRVCTEFFRSEYVVEAKILSSRKIPDTPDPNNVEGWFYKVQVQKTYRGGKLPNDEIYTGNDETKFAMEVGKSYLLFINMNLQSRAQPDTCGNSGELPKAKPAVDAVQAILEAAGKGGDFGQMLSGVLNGAVESGQKAETQVAAAASGKADLVNVVTAVAESETALQTLVAVRDRVISAYEEIMRMQV